MISAAAFGGNVDINEPALGLRLQITGDSTK